MMCYARRILTGAARRDICEVQKPNPRWNTEKENQPMPLIRSMLLKETQSK